MILNRQKKIRIAKLALEAFLLRVLRETGLQGTEVTVALVSDREIARWNEVYRRKKGPTDVLSFPALSLRRAARRKRIRRGALGTGGRDAIGFLGDIAIAPETARRYAKKNKREFADELRVLMLHGVLHLMGFDHESRSDYGEMERVESKLRRKLGLA
jgi:probable rRNA maturation factor